MHVTYGCFYGKMGPKLGVQYKFTVYTTLNMFHIPREDQVTCFSKTFLFKKDFIESTPMSIISGSLVFL